MPSDESRAPWTHPQKAYFWLQMTPFVVKFEIEKRTGTLLERSRTQSHPLTFRGTYGFLEIEGPIELRLEAAMLNGILYSISFDASQNPNQFGEAAFRLN